MSDWAKHYIERSKNGETVQFRPRGNSMYPLISDRQLVTVEPVKDEKLLKAGNIVLCMVGMNHFLHLIKEVRKGDAGRLNFLIGNNKGGLNGGCYGNHIYGIFVRAE